TRVPFSRMNEALQRLIRQGGKVVSVVVSGDGAATAAPTAAASAQAAEAPRAGGGKTKGGRKQG
ncbi:MAG: phycobilisome linker polypeptide, partial [Vulcanococcus sp.]